MSCRCLNEADVQFAVAEGQTVDGAVFGHANLPLLFRNGGLWANGHATTAGMAKLLEGHHLPCDTDNGAVLTKLPQRPHPVHLATSTSGTPTVTSSVVSMCGFRKI